MHTYSPFPFPLVILFPMNRKSALLDVLAICLSLLAILLSTQMGSGGGGTLKVQTESDSYLYALDKDRTLSFTGPLGETVVSVKDGKATIVSSPCETKDCTRMGPVTENGGFAACLPNKVMITSVSGNTEVDDVAD